MQDIWGHDPERGRIRDVLVDDIIVEGDHLLRSEIMGFDEAHAIEGITFRNVRLEGQPPATDAESLHLERIEHARDIRIER